MNIKIDLNLPEQVAKELNSFVRKLVGPAAEVSELLSEKVRFFRFRSAMKTLALAEKMMDEAGRPVNLVPVKFLVPFLEESSLEEDDSPLHEKWAALLANTSSNRTADNNRKFIDILKNLDHLEVALLDSMWCSHAGWEAGRGERLTEFARSLEYESQIELSAQIDPQKLVEELKGSGRLVWFWHCDDIPSTNEFSIYGNQDIENLFHLRSFGLVDIFSRALPAMNGRHYLLVAELTPFGCAFVEACMKPEF